MSKTKAPPRSAPPAASILLPSEPAWLPRATILWQDSSQPESCWHKIGEIAGTPLQVIRTTGFILRNDNEMIVIASSVSDQHATGVIRIPSRAVVGVFQLFDRRSA